MLGPEPLPRTPQCYTDWKEADLEYSRAYDLVLEAEEHAQAEDNDTIVLARVVGYLLIELFDRRQTLTMAPYRCVVKEITSEARVSGEGHFDPIFEVGKRYRDRFLRPLFRTTTTMYPESSQHPSRSEADSIEAMTRKIMKADGKDYRTSKNKALARDGYRCLLTGWFNRSSSKKSPQLKKLCRELDEMTAQVQACHIISESTMQGVDPEGGGRKAVKTGHAVGAMAILEMFGLRDLYTRLLARDGIHHVGNLLSLEHHCHSSFDSLEIWFEATEEPHEYRVCFAVPRFERFVSSFGYLGEDHLVKFPKCDVPGVSVTLPDPQLLALHAVCARVAHMSGAAEAFYKLDCDLEDTIVLASDGSSAHLLDHVLAPFAVTTST